MNDSVAGKLVVGIGSPQGDDCVGWRAAELLAPRLARRVLVLTVSDPIRILDHLEGCTELWIIDACRSGRRPGSVSRLQWPDERVNAGPRHSSHAMSLPDALRLAENLGRLPPSTFIYTIEIGAGAERTTPVGTPAAGAVAEADKRAASVGNAIVPGGVSPGTAMSPAVAGALPELQRRILADITTTL